MCKIKVIVVKDIIYPNNRKLNVYIGTICEIYTEDLKNNTTWVRLFGVNGDFLGKYSKTFGYYELLSRHREKQINSILND